MVFQRSIRVCRFSHIEDVTVVEDGDSLIVDLSAGLYKGEICIGHLSGKCFVERVAILRRSRGKPSDLLSTAMDIVYDQVFWIRVRDVDGSHQGRKCRSASGARVGVDPVSWISNSGSGRTMQMDFYVCVVCNGFGALAFLTFCVSFKPASYNHHDGAGYSSRE